MSVKILVGDCRELLRTLPAASVDSVVTDPPYGLSFMGKAWDYDVPGVDVWRECLRVLKPGGHLLAFAGTRTQHRMAVNIEDAGFEIRDMIAWVYGSGFPKSLDVSKAIDKTAGAERVVIGQRKKLQSYGADVNNVYGGGPDKGGMQLVTAPSTDQARQWHGWGTALKPALEPITVARKPLTDTVAQNVLAHGTGALNIDGCRVPSSEDLGNGVTESNATVGYEGGFKTVRTEGSPLGRWPANVIHDGSKEVTRHFPEGSFNPADVFADDQPAGWSGGSNNVGRSGSATRSVFGYGDTGSAARFFYCAKADRDDRGEGNNHPTVKPADLMRYLCRLVTPPGGTVLDPFAGSGSTLLAADREGFSAIGIELNSEYAEIARRRIRGDAPLFAEVA